MVEITDSPKLYVGTYAKYNDGSIEGKWLDLTEYEDKESFLESCKALHKDESDPELMYQDFENFPKSLYNESYLDDRLWDWLALDEDEREKVGEYWDEIDSSANPDDIVNAYQGNVNDMKDGRWISDEEAYGWYVVDEGLFGAEIPEALENYIDYESIGRDWLMDISKTDSGNLYGSW